MTKELFSYFSFAPSVYLFCELLGKACVYSCGEGSIVLVSKDFTGLTSS